MRTFEIHIRTGTKEGIWSSAHDTPTFMIEACDHGHAASICAHIPAHNPAAQWHNFFILDVKAGSEQIYTTRPGKDGSWCAVRLWDAKTDLQ